MDPKNFKYCPKCKSDLKNTDDFFDCENCGMKIYKDSSPTVSVLIVDGDRVLLSRRGVKPFLGLYDVIGGFLKPGEHPFEGVGRETKEETGLDIKIISLLGIYMDKYGPGGNNTLNFYYIGEILNGEPKPADDVEELTWFPIDKLPKPAFKSQVKVFEDLKKWVSNR